MAGIKGMKILKSHEDSPRFAEYLIIWESEYKADKEKTLQKCIDFIKS